METTTKPIETKKLETEEKKGVNTELDTTKVLASEDKKSDTGVSSKDTSDEKPNTKDESNDSEDIGFEIITPDLTEKTDNVQSKASIEVKKEPDVAQANIKEENQQQEQKQVNDQKIVDEKIENKEDTAEASLIDIKVIKEAGDGSNKDSPESDAQGSEELELALKAMPDLSSSVSNEILAKANDEEAKTIVDDIETKTEERPGGTLIDITVIEETKKDKNVQEVIKEAEHSFEAEVIEDNEEIKVVPSDDEDVIEYTLEARHILPFLTILVAFVAIFVGLIFYYN